jgi:threonine aldolase
MREAMMNADVGDDVFGDDPTVNKLERLAAQMLGMEAALFVPSGTMGNLICVLTHCSGRGDEVILGDESHLAYYEQGGVAQLGGVYPRSLRNLPDGTFDFDELKSRILPDDPHFTKTRLVCVENTHNRMGGRVIPLSFMDQLAETLKGTGIKIHVDGARLFHAATALKLPVTSLLKHADSVSVCLSKALSAPIGSVIAGRRDFIGRAHRLRKALGGGMRQVGVIAAPGIIALEKMTLRLQEDHDKTQAIAKGMAAMSDLGLKVNVETVETNIIYFELSRDDMTAFEFADKLEEVGREEIMSASVKILALTPTRLRLVVHHQVTRDGVDTALAKMRAVLEKK